MEQPGAEWAAELVSLVITARDLARGARAARGADWLQAAEPGSWAANGSSVKVPPLLRQPQDSRPPLLILLTITSYNNSPWFWKRIIHAENFLSQDVCIYHYTSDAFCLQYCEVANHSLLK